MTHGAQVMTIPKSTLRPIHYALALLLASVAVPSAANADGPVIMRPGENVGFTYIVGWKVLDADQGLPIDAQLVLYWFPLSAEDAMGSPLGTSHGLSRVTERCVAAMVVPPDDSILHARYHAAKGEPLVVLAERSGAELLRVPAEHGKFEARKVEKAVNAALGQREDATAAALKNADALASAGDKTAAIASLQKVWAARCLFPNLARKAAKALEKLGVPM